MEKTTIKKILLLISLLLVVIILLRECNKKTVEYYDSSIGLQNDNIKLFHRIKILSDSVNHLDTNRAKVVLKYRWLKGRIDSVPCDTLIKKIVHICDTMVVIDSTEIAKLKEININYSKVVLNDSAIISIKDHKIDSLIHSKKKFWKGLKTGLIIGSATTGAVISGLLIK